MLRHWSTQNLAQFAALPKKKPDDFGHFQSGADDPPFLPWISLYWVTVRSTSKFRGATTSQSAAKDG